MKIAIIGDIHGSHRSLKRIIKDLKAVDMIFITGDIGGTVSVKLLLKSIVKTKKISREAYAKLVFSDFLSDFTKYQLKTAKKIVRHLLTLGVPIFITHGNADVIGIHDYLAQMDKEYDLVSYVGNSTTIYNNIAVVGYGYCMPSAFYSFAEFPGIKERKDIEQDLAKLSESLGPAKIVFGLFHEPPLDTQLDFIPNKNIHVGSDLLRDHILELSYSYVFCGHIHESQGTQFLNDSLLLNPGPLVNGKWAILNTENNQVELKHNQAFFSIKNLIYMIRRFFP